MALAAMSLGDRFCMSRKGGIVGGGWVHPKGGNSMAVRYVERSWLALGGPFLSFLALTDFESSCLACIVGPPFPYVHGLFFSYVRLAFLGRCDCKFVNWWMWFKSRSCFNHHN